LCFTQVSDLSPLLKLANLESLAIEGKTNYKSLEKLKQKNKKINIELW